MKKIVGVRKAIKYLILSGLIVVFIGLKFEGFFQNSELRLYDHWWEKAPVEKREPRIVIVGLDETDLTEHFGQYPPSDEQLAKVIEKIEAQKPAVIGLDIIRDLGVEGRLAEIFRRSETLVGVGDFHKFDFPPILKQRRRVGTVEVPEEPDGRGYARRVLLYSKPDGTADSLISHLGLKLVREYLKHQGNYQEVYDFKEVMVNGRKIPLFRETYAGYSPQELRNSYQLVIRWRKGNYSPEQWEDRFAIVTARDLVGGQIDPELFTDKIVLIGYRTPSIKDLFATPIGNRYGVDLIAHVTSQILSFIEGDRPLMGSSPEWLEYLLGIALISLAYLQSRFLSYRNLLRECWIQGGMVVAIALSLELLGYQLFLQGIWLPVWQLRWAYGVSAAFWLLGSYLVHFHWLSQNLEKEVARRMEELSQKNQQLSESQALLQDYQNQLILQEKQILLTDLSTNINHSLKNYTFVLRGCAERMESLTRNLKEGGKDSRSQKKWKSNLVLMKATLYSLEKLLVKFKGIYQNEEWLKPTSVDIQEVVMEIVREQSWLKKEDISLAMDVSHVSLIGPRKLIAEMVRNLIENALEAMRESPRKKLSLQAYQENQQLVLKISDTGGGIPSAILEKIYEPHFTTKENGWGFGLYYVYQTVRFFKGEITCDSQVDEGTSFTVRLPLNGEENSGKKFSKKPFV